MKDNLSTNWRQKFLGITKENKNENKGIIKHVIKRDGQLEFYNPQKIYNAINSAAIECGIDNPELIKRLTYLTEKKLEEFMSKRHKNSATAIEEIQDIVETVLIEEKQVAIAKAYIIYREKHKVIRDSKKLMLDIDATMEGYLSQSDWRVNENSNVNYSLGGLILHNSGTITANYWLKNIYPEEIAEAHINADFHLHDLSMFSGYCAGWSLRQLI